MNIQEFLNELMKLGEQGKLKELKFEDFMNNDKDINKEKEENE